MKKYLIMLSCSVLFFSCNNEEPAPDTIPQEESVGYIFESIEFYLAEGDGMTLVDTVFIDAVKVDNNTGERISSQIEMPDQHDTSEFVTDEWYPVSVKGGYPCVATPESIENSEVVLGELPWDYTSSQQFRLSPKSGYIYTFSVNTERSIHVEAFGRWRIMRASYKVYYREISTGETITVDGVWHGNVLEGYRFVSNYSVLPGSDI